MTKVYAPNREYKGISAGVQFKAGVGATDDAAALAYFANAGYGIGEYKGPPTEQVLVDARDVSQPIPLGSRLRDAAVDPMPQDFLPPTNAGQADPHGPEVVSPQIHGSETGPIVAGDVHVDDVDIQEAKETAADEATFVDGSEVNAVAATDRPSASASKAEWVEFAVGQGLERDEAEDMKKADLQARLAEGA